VDPSEKLVIVNEGLGSRVLERTSDLRESEQRIQQALRLSHSFTFDWDIATDQVRRSESCADILHLSGEEAVNDVGGRFFQRVLPDDRPGFQSVLAGLTAGSPDYTTEYRLKGGNGEVAILEEMGQGEFDAEGKLTRVFGVTTDISARKNAEEKLRLSEERFRATFDNAAVGIAHIGPDGRWLRFNNAISTITGYTRDELSKLTFADITHPDDLQADLEQAEQLYAGEIPTYSMEKRYIRKDGSDVWVNLTGSLVRGSDGTPEYAIAIVEDITDRKLAEEKLRVSEERLRELNTSLEKRVKEGIAELSEAYRERMSLLKRLANVEESERRRLAQEIHDVFGQAVTAIRLNLAVLQSGGPVADMSKKLALLANLCQELDTEATFLTYALRPTALKERGLAHAIGVFTDGWSRRSGIEATFVSDYLDESAINLETASNLYRIVQEALNNCAKHSHARNVRIGLTKEAGKIVLTVEDDGCGFDVHARSKAAYAGGHLGITGIQERALIISGSAHIRSAPGKGTLIRVEVPEAETAQSDKSAPAPRRRRNQNIAK
jgi:two-component system, NarL family, sensor histidine kinase UhpB